MDFNKINDTLTVSGQILPQDVTILKEKGFKSLIINRPDEETDATTCSAAVIDAAKIAGLEVVYLPIYPGQFTPELVEATQAAFASMPAPVYAYCRSGTRSTFAWGMSQAGKIEADEIMKQAADGGYDLSPVAGYLAGK